MAQAPSGWLPSTSGDANGPALPTADGDAVPDYGDVKNDTTNVLDIDRAGLGGLDANNDDVLDSPTDADKDGIRDSVEGAGDFDGDGVPNYIPKSGLRQ